MANDSASPGETGTGWAGYCVGPALLLVAAWFVYGTDLAEIPDCKASVVHKQFLTTAPRRTILGDPPMITLDGFTRTCNSCHMIFPAREEAPAKLLRHQHIKLDHGINDRCRNCHDVRNRNDLVLYSGIAISYANVVELCAKCHGPIYRDWERGMHGRTNDYWSRESGSPHKLGCTECHDPHNPRVPAMDQLMPLPAPRTLRMGDHEEHDGGEEKIEQDPLRRALRRADKAAAGMEENAH